MRVPCLTQRGGFDAERLRKTLIRRMFEQYPDPPGLPARGYDVHDRAEARQAILRKLRTVQR